jgi:hypothetical protein
MAVQVTWDFKPGLVKANGQKLDGFDPTTGFFDNAVGPLLKSPFEFQQHGQSGMWASSLFPHLSQHVDKMAFIKSFHTQSNNHSPALFMANTGVTRMGNPCVGSWVTYGLGTANQNLPAFVVMSDPLDRGLPKGHAANWSNGFLPGARIWDGWRRYRQRGSRSSSIFFSKPMPRIRRR